MSDKHKRWMWLPLAALQACSLVTHEEGISLEVNLVHHTGESEEAPGVRYPEGAVRGLVTDERFGVTLERALLTLSELQLLPCDGSEPSQAAAGVESGRPWLAWLAALPRLLSPVGTARAHGDSSPLVHAAPIVFDMMDADRTVRFMASMAPPPGRYCGVRLKVASADADAENIEGAPDMEGKSMLLAGRFVRFGEPEEHGFELSSSLEDRVDLAFSRPLALTMEAPDGYLLLELDYGDVLDGVDLSGEADPLLQLHVVRNLLGGVTADVCAQSGCAHPHGTDAE